MKAIILAGGYGTRLGDLTKSCAKPMLKVGQKPLVEHIVDKLQKLSSISSIHIVTNAKFYQDFVCWKDRTSRNVTIINDGTTCKEDRLGSIGDIQFVIEKENIDDDILIVGGDNYFEDDLVSFIQLFEQKGSANLLYDVKSVDLAKQLGVVKLDDTNRIVEFHEKVQNPPSTLASALIYAIKKTHLPLIKSALVEGFADRAGDFIRYLSTKDAVYGHLLTGEWYDIGTKQQLERAKSHSLSMKVAVFGTGYVGLVTGACLASLGHRVICVDIDEAKIASIQAGKIPFFEPGLGTLVVKNKEKGKLSFTTDAKAAIDFADVIFNCVGTPSAQDGSCNLEYVFSVAKTLATHATSPKILINKSTVPAGTAKKCDELIRQTNPRAVVDVISNPEFLKEGSAVHDFTHPDKIVIGAVSHHAAAIVRRLYSGRIRTYIPIIETNWETAEMIKYANNSFLATKISFINEIANICDGINADVRLVAQAMGLDYRISPKFLNAGVGYGGSCFPKDVRALVNTAKKLGQNPLLLDAVDKTNENQKRVILGRIVERFGQDLTGKVFSIWGLSFKPNTSDMREAPSLTIVPELLKRGATLKVYDPIAMDEAKKELGENLTYCKRTQETVEGSDAIVLLTEWNEFRNANLPLLAQKMRQRVLFDGRNIYEPEFVKEEGFEYIGIGRK